MLIEELGDILPKDWQPMDIHNRRHMKSSILAFLANKHSFRSTTPFRSMFMCDVLVQKVQKSSLKKSQNSGLTESVTVNSSDYRMTNNTMLDY
ncbi:hypothetical protein NQ317_014409 [Molorchus minor]|uniref:Uncharacterized protein n=1 Tax=Molorchus minor TaxID=1323400 RepID=A0ABQ9K563_9CUCU|nr:hypothetical protein NQ317_014409 [Molorchus minor]